jgi:hypothetical protein
MPSIMLPVITLLILLTWPAMAKPLPFPKQAGEECPKGYASRVLWCSAIARHHTPSHAQGPAWLPFRVVRFGRVLPGTGAAALTARCISRSREAQSTRTQDQMPHG